MSKLEAIEMLETRTVHSKQRVRGTVLAVGQDVSLENATYLVARKEAKSAPLPMDEAAEPSEEEAPAPAPIQKPTGKKAPAKK